MTTRQNPYIKYSPCPGKTLTNINAITYKAQSLNVVPLNYVRLNLYLIHPPLRFPYCMNDPNMRVQAQVKTDHRTHTKKSFTNLLLVVKQLFVSRLTCEPRYSFLSHNVKLHSFLHNNSLFEENWKLSKLRIHHLTSFLSRRRKLAPPWLLFF